MKKVVHLTSLHQRYDPRIFIKECSSLAKKEKYKVYLIVADGKGDEIKNDVKIIDVGKPKHGVYRIIISTKKVLREALKLNAYIYHLHDPELIPIGNKLSRKRKKVIFDSHEDIPLQILNKAYLHKYIRILLSKLFPYYEKISFKNYSYIITPTQFIKKKFLEINKNTEVIYNYPILKEVYIESPLKQINKENEICYIGAITMARGIKELIKSLEYVEVQLNLGGKIVESNVEKEIKSYVGWKQVNNLGFIDRKKVKEILYTSKIGMVTLHHTDSYKDALPVKMFEYMASGLPVIASDIPLWKTIIDDTQCGLCVDPYNPKAIANAINQLINNPKLADKMGINGQNAIQEKYNWNYEESKLFKIYEQIIGQVEKNIKNENNKI